MESSLLKQSLRATYTWMVAIKIYLLENESKTLNGLDNQNCFEKSSCFFLNLRVLNSSDI